MQNLTLCLLRTVVGVTNTFEKFIEHEDFETYLDEKENRLRHRILPNAKPTWDGVDIPQAQKFLNDSGLETFLAEYQNEFEHLKTEKVVHEILGRSACYHLVAV